MLSLSRRSEYGILFLLALANTPQNTHISLNKLVKNAKLPYRFLSQIAVDLKKAGYVDSKEGLGGGYFLKKTLKQISLKDIVETLDQPLAIVDCQRHKFCHMSGKCQIKPVWDDLHQKLSAILKAYTLEDFRTGIYLRQGD